MYKEYIKHILDFILSVIGFIILSPIFLIVTIALLIVNRGKPFFIQKRPGKNNQTFKIIKFKTMNDKKDKDGNLLADSERLTWIGAFIRKTSVDEIPQLLNVIKGDMSLVGPRPLLVDYLILYDDEQKRRHEVRPGITGLAQINGRNTLSWSEKFHFDIQYVDNMSFLLDVKMIYKTIIKLFNTKEISSITRVTMEKFEGNI